ncbi:Uncharacterized protein APZ42_031976 [Daphnia magna]|uniref:Uncharacterized protein n=1 Tax=Daphnia magna TaxID=35525 RepID=A0A164MEW3_9CRUS|nr:Uncharacterized protein APZ42_031976 [Daphnia magna]
MEFQRCDRRSSILKPFRRLTYMLNDILHICLKSNGSECKERRQNKKTGTPDPSPSNWTVNVDNDNSIYIQLTPLA